MTAQLIHPDRSVRRGHPGRRIDTGQKVGPGSGQIEDLVLIELPLVEAKLDRLGSPQAELGVPQRAVGLR